TPHIALLHRSAPGAIQSTEHILLFHMEAVDVIEFPIPGFGDHRQTEMLSVRKFSRSPLHHRIAGHSDTVSVGQQDRPFQKTRFFYPFSAGHFSVAIKRIDRRRHWRITVRLPERKNGGHAGADWSLADHEFPFSFDQGCLTHLDSTHIRDGIQCSRRALKWNSQVAGTVHGGGNVSRNTETIKTANDSDRRAWKKVIWRSGFHHRSWNIISSRTNSTYLI